VIRDLADVVLVGAATATAEQYRSPQRSPKRAAIRAHYGLAAHLAVALVSRTLEIDTTIGLFADDAPPPLILTCAKLPSAQARQALAGKAEVINCGDHDVDLRQVQQVLDERGLRRIACEGGPTLFAAFAVAGLVDELCLSVSPFLVGPGPDRITRGTPWPDGHTAPLALHTTLEENGALFHRYRRVAPTTTPGAQTR